MKYKYIIILSLILSVISVGKSQSTFCLSFTNPAITNAGTTFEFDINMTGSGPSYNLGTSNLVFIFNKDGLTEPTLVNHTFDVANFDVPTVTKPLPNRASFNIVLNNDNNGLPISIATPKRLGRISFTIINPALMSNLNWLYNGLTTTTVVFDDIFPGVAQLFATDNNTTCLQPLFSPLPVKLLSFISRANEQSIDLFWKTASAINASHFDVQRSTNGINFNNIGRLDVNNSRESNDYTYRDNDVTAGRKYYYRLVLNDFDGKYDYSDIISDMIQAKNLSFSVYPNPAAKNMMIYVITSDKLNNFFRLYDGKNALVREQSFVESLQVETLGLSTGIYYYKIENEVTVENGKLIIID